MTPEERKTIAMRHAWVPSVDFATHNLHYPRCCPYHEGFDAALALLVAAPMWTDGNDWHGDSSSGAQLFAIEDTP